MQPALNNAQLMISGISSNATNTAQSPDFTTTIRPHHGGGHHGGASKIASSIISEADSDGNGSISKDELSTMLSNKLGSSASASDISSKVDAIFKQVDTDGDGSISQTELTAALKKAHDQQQVQGASGITNASGTTDSLASVMSSLMGPPPDAGYNASGTATGSYNVNTFLASA